MVSYVERGQGFMSRSGAIKMAESVALMLPTPTQTAHVNSDFLGYNKDE